ncbi:hypothetical protein ACE193_00720 [Bernardetia sp. OM2101]|uniref:hypothetical protein n=1 Tax=Bernardetia sp. OM2101 TaxID=3344876 RepID=UPI0035CFED7A
MIQKRAFKSLLLALFFLNSSFILAQNETYWAITEAFPVRNDTTIIDADYRKVLEKVRQKIKPFIIQKKDKKIYWSDCINEENKDCSQTKLPRYYRKTEIIGDSLLYIKIRVSRKKKEDFFLIYRKVEKEIPKEEILKFTYAYLNHKDSLILFLKGKETYFNVKHYFGNIYTVKFEQYGESKEYFTLFSIKDEILTVLYLEDKNEKSGYLAINWLLEFEDYIIFVEPEVRYIQTKENIGLFLNAQKRKIFTWYFTLNK